MNQFLKKILLALILIALFIPLLQSTLKLFDVRGLDGEYSTVEKPQFTFKGFSDLSYQNGYNDYLNKNFGLREPLIRAHNQLNFNLFRYTTSPGVIIGKNDYLFIGSYIDNYTGKNFIGEEQINYNVKQIKNVQDALKKKNIDLLIVFAAGKATYYSEYIPDKYMAAKKEQTNYKSYRDEFKKADVNFIDLNAYFLSQKGKSKYPIFSQYGTHWSYYAIGFAADTITHFIEKKRNIIMPHIDYNSHVTMSDSLHGPDYDVGELLNLQKVLPHDPMPYPAYEYKEEAGAVKPSVLVIGDSHWHNLIYAGIPGHLFKQNIFWRYFKDEYIDNQKQATSPADIKIADKVLQQDVVVIMCTEATLHEFPFGFIDKLQDELGYGTMSYEEKIAVKEREIRSKPDWLKMVQQKAIDQHIPLDSMIYMDAKFVVDTEKK